MDPHNSYQYTNIAYSVVSGKFLENPGDENFLSSVSVGMDIRLFQVYCAITREGNHTFFLSIH